MTQKLLAFTECLHDIPLETEAIPPSKLNIEQKRRSNLFPWNGQFSPQLISALLEAYAQPGATVLDPFMGSGTVLVESGRRGLAATGADINPAPFKITSLYEFINLGQKKRNEAIGHIESDLQSVFSSSVLSNGRGSSETYVKTALTQIAEGQECHNSQILIEALIVLVDFYSKGINAERVFQKWLRLKEQVSDLPFAKTRIRPLNCDARRLPLGNSTINLTITSPPYINVFNYHQKYRASVEALGWDLLSVAKSEIGSNRKHRQNRFLTVIQYCLDMSEALSEIHRTMSEGGRLILVVGRESQVRKTAFYNADIVARLATGCLGLVATCRQERHFINRFGNRIYEDILHFDISGHAVSQSACPRAVAESVLKQAEEYAPKESLPDLYKAIDSVALVQSSAIYGAAK